MITNLKLKMLLMTMWMILMMLLVRYVFINVENVVHSTEINDEVQELFEDDRN